MNSKHDNDNNLIVVPLTLSFTLVWPIAPTSHITLCVALQ
jgi:hypothetical protein